MISSFLSQLSASFVLTALLVALPVAVAQQAKSSVTTLQEAFDAIDLKASPARQRLAVRRLIRDAENALQEAGPKPERWAILEFQFKAQQRLVAMDEDSKHRQFLLEIGRELVKAPKEYSVHKLEADLLLSQVEQARTGEKSNRGESLLAFVKRYVGTPAGPKALQTAIVMGLEMGDTRLVNKLRNIAAEYHSSDLEMITFLRDKLGGQVFGVPFVGNFKRSDGRTMAFPMDGLGHTTRIIFWSKDSENILQYLSNMAAAYKFDKDRVDGRLHIVSANLDDLPDAGESMIRSIGADWPCLHFPGGRGNPRYIAYVRNDPRTLHVAPTGQTAMVMAGTTRKPVVKKPDELKLELEGIKPPDAETLKMHTESFRRTLIRGWSRDDYALHLAALMSGDFLLFDPNGFEAAAPPELEAAFKGGKVALLSRTDGSVPTETLEAIQGCLIPAPRRYHIHSSEVRAAYRKMQALCKKAISEYPNAPDLWIVRNRLIISHLGLWKTDFDLKQFEAAVAESNTAIAAGYPKGCGVIARFTLARQALRESGAKWPEIIDAYIADQGGDSASGPVFATASLLALDVADEARYQTCRDLIISNHTEYPMMWLYSSFLLSRYHDYWMFQVPFTAGWSFGRRFSYEMRRGGVEQAERYLKCQLPTMDGKTMRIPEDLKAKYTAILLAQPQPWKGRDREDPKPPSPTSVLRSLPSYVDGREDAELMIAMLGEMDEAAIREHMKPRNAKEPWSGTILKIPGGIHDPLVHRLGLLDHKGGMVLLNKQGRILDALSKDALGSNYSIIPDTVHILDEAAIMAALNKKDVKTAEALIMKHVPPYDPEAKDERGRSLPKPKYSLPHLRARCQYYVALKDWNKALVDAEAVVASQLASAGGMSLRTPELDESEALRDEIKEIKKQAEK